MKIFNFLQNTTEFYQTCKAVRHSLKKSIYAIIYIKDRM